VKTSNLTYGSDVWNCRGVSRSVLLGGWSDMFTAGKPGQTCLLLASKWERVFRKHTSTSAEINPDGKLPVRMEGYFLSSAV
jgi:hypothetical protein